MPAPRWYPRGSGTRPPNSISPWDVIELAGEALPGRGRITQASAAWKIDDKKAAGKDADRPTKYGFDATTLGFEIDVVNVEEMEAVNRALAPYIPRPGGDFVPVSIYHPSLIHMTGSFSMSIRNVSEWKRNGAVMTIAVSGAPWAEAEKPAPRGKETKVATPTKIKNARRAAANAKTNPAPTTQGGYCSPNFTPGV